jgi:hypothetical protein
MFQASHTGHHTKNVVIHGIHANLGSVCALNGGVGENKLQGCVINTREVARAGRLVLLGPQSEGIQVDSGVWGASVVLPRLHEVKVGALTLREAVLAVKLELSSHDWVLTPAMHIEGSLGEHEGAGIRDTGRVAAHIGKMGKVVCGASSGVNIPPSGSSGVNIVGTGIVEETGGIDVRGGGAGNAGLGAEGVDGVGESIDGVGVVEGLGAEETVENSARLEGRAVVNVLVGLNNPDKLLNGVVKVELDLVGRGTDGLITGELELLDEVLVGVLGHTPALISVQEDVVDIERCSDEGLVVSSDSLERSRPGEGGRAQSGDGEQALLDGADVKVDLHLVVLKSNEGKGQTGVTAEPELKGDVKGGLGESVTGSANLTRGVSIARAIDGVEQGVSDEGQLGGVADHLEVAALLLSGHSKLVPDVHPVTVLAINALATDLNLNLGNQLLTWEVEPTGINTAVIGLLQGLTDLGQSDLKVSAVSQITITRNGAGHATTEIGLAVKSLLDRLHSEVGVTLVRNLPESNLGVASQINVLCAIGDKLHKSSSHCKMLVILLSKKKKTEKYTFLRKYTFYVILHEMHFS